MTREEAIEIIKCGDIYNRWGKDGEEVEKMAIKALEQQTCTREDFIQYAKEHYGIDIEFKDSDKPDTFNELFGVEVCEDAVSREAAIDALKQLQKNISGDYTVLDPMVIAGTAYIGDCIGELQDLPSVQPVGKDIHVPCTDAISRQAVLDIFANNADATRPYSTAWEKIRDLPSVNPQPKIGHWEWVQYDYNPKLGNWHCSECRCVVVECVDKNEKGGIPLYKYCPQCGAKMAESEDKE